MAYSLSYSIDIGTAGLTFKAALVHQATIHATFRDVTTTFYDDGQGQYEFFTAAIPSGYRGNIVFYVGTVGVATDFSGVTIKATGSVNPEEAEDIALILAASSSGSGPKAVTIHTTDGTSALGAVLIAVLDNTNAAKAIGATDGSANYTANLLPSTTYTINAYKDGYTSIPSSQTTTAGTGPQTFADIVLTAVTSIPTGGMTKAQLRTAIKLEARLASTTELDTMIYTIIDDVVADVFSKERCYELKVIGTGNAMAAATPTITLPSDFQHVDEVRFSTDNGATTPTKLRPKNDFTPISFTGVPEFWQIVGANLYVFPYSQVTTSHKIYLDYYKVPVFAVDADVFPVVRLQAAVKKECITRLLEYANSLEQASRMLASSEKSLERGTAANPEGRDRDSIDTRLPGTGTVPLDTK